MIYGQLMACKNKQLSMELNSVVTNGGFGGWTPTGGIIKHNLFFLMGDIPSTWNEWLWLQMCLSYSTELISMATSRKMQNKKNSYFVKVPLILMIQAAFFMSSNS